MRAGRVSRVRRRAFHVPRCLALTSSTAFTGTIRDVRARPGGRYVVTFDVDETLLGRAPPRIATVEVVETTSQPCRISLASHERVLVVASVLRPDTIVASCGEMRRAALATEDIAFVRAFAHGTTGAIEGTVRFTADPLRNAPDTPVAGVVVRVEGSAIATRTNADGFYRLSLPPGEYVVVADADARYADAWYPGRSPVRVGRRSCDERDLVRVSNGRIRGHLVDRDGRPAANVSVTLLDPAHPIPQGAAPVTITDATGAYELGRLPSGSYVVATLGARRTFYGGATLATARRVTVGDGTVTDAVDFTTP